MSYIPDKEERFFDKCFIQKIENELYKIECSPKRRVFAPLKTLIIDITNIASKGNLRTLIVRNLEDTSETFLIPPEDTPGYINYENPKIYFIKKDKNGLSAGAIIAIIIASIVAVLAVIFIIIKFNRPVKPFIKNSDFVNIPNSSTTINKY